MHSSFMEEVRKITRQMIDGLSLSNISVEEDHIVAKRRVCELLERSEAEGKIVDFISADKIRCKIKGKRVQVDFLLSLIKGGEHRWGLVKVEVDEKKRKYSRKRKSGGTVVLAAGPQYSDKYLKHEWERALIHLISN